MLELLLLLLGFSIFLGGEWDTWGGAWLEGLTRGERDVPGDIRGLYGGIGKPRNC